MKKHPGTAGAMPVKGTGCGIRPDLDEIGADTGFGFDFSAAAGLLSETAAETPTATADTSAAASPATSSESAITTIEKPAIRN